MRIRFLILTMLTMHILVITLILALTMAFLLKRTWTRLHQLMILPLLTFLLLLNPKRFSELGLIPKILLLLAILKHRITIMTTKLPLLT